MMPSKFWILCSPDSDLVWDRNATGFVPTASLKQADPKRFWFLTEEEIKSKLDEFKAMGVKVKSVEYSLTVNAGGK